VPTVDFDHAFSQVGGSPHPHACIIFDDLTSYRNIASKYILEGLSKNEKCIMAVDDYTETMIRDDFTAVRENIDHYLEDERLVIFNVQESYAGNGGFDPDKTVTIWQKISKEAVDGGFDALRVVGEATFSLRSPELAEKLIYYENIINQVLFPSYPFKSLCVYNKRLYPPEIIKTAISAHPILFHNDELFLENIHYVPPHIHFKKQKARDEIEVWLANVKRNNQNIQALRESENKFRALFENAPLSYQSLDENGDFLDVNETWLTVLGYTRDEVIGRNFAEFLHPDWKAHFKQNFPRFKAVGEVLGVEFEIRKKDGSFILVSFNGKIGKHPDQSFQQTHCIFQDITEKKQEEERRIHAKKMEFIRTLSQRIAHDFNNLLLPITGMAELLMAELPEDSDLYENALEILNAGQKGSVLVNEIMSLGSRTDL
jgi:PAS domain S-box-containing protein